MIRARIALAALLALAACQPPGGGNNVAVAVLDVDLDGVRLEGAGVMPDIEVPFVLTSYTAQSSNWALLAVGIVNTMLITLISAAAATVLGFLIGIARLSTNWLLSTVLRLESVWLRWFDEPFGSSLLCVAKKP